MCFAELGLPRALKTDNTPAYISQAFRLLCSMFKISHSTGIPYNPRGQGIVKRAHQTLKIQISRLQEGNLKYFPPPSS